MQRKAHMNVLLGCAVLASAPALAEPTDTAAKAFENGKVLLTSAKFDEALQAFKTAAQADQSNSEYRQQYAMLRQVIQMRGRIQNEADADRWLSMAQALRTFYHDHGVHSESLPLDRKIHEQHLAPDSAAMLAETLLALGYDSEAAKVVSNVSTTDVTPRAKILLGIALARQGQIDQAKVVLQTTAMKVDSPPRSYFELARLRALVGDSKGSLKALTRSFELTPPARIDSLKAEIHECQDFATIAHSAGFTVVMNTPSKVQESGCSKGPSCGKCPKRAACGKESCGKGSCGGD